MNLGAEPKKVAILGVIVVVGVVLLIMDFSGSDTPASTPRVVPAATSVSTPTVAGKAADTERGRGRRVAISEFRPRIGTRPEDRVDPATIDPELRLDLLAKVQAVEPISAGRNIFQFGSAPPPPQSAAKLPAVPTNVPKIPVNQPPPHPVVVAVGPPAPPPPPPILLKYYGYKISKADGRKQAFLLDGDEVMLATENQTIKHYRIVRIALTSIVIEDTQSKSTQTLQLQQAPV